MEGLRRRSRTIVIAVGCSLFAHALVLPFVHAPAVAREAPAGPPDLYFVQPPPRRRPQPTPAPSPQPQVPRLRSPLARTQPLKRMAHLTPHVRANANAHPSAPGRATAFAPRGGDVTKQDGDASARTSPGETLASTEPTAEASLAPALAPTPLPTQTCANVPRDATVLEAITPERSDVARAQGAIGRVEVRVDLTVTGSVGHASIFKSSGFAALDEAAIRAAERARYAPATDGCVPVAGSYLYTVDFSE